MAPDNSSPNKQSQLDYPSQAYSTRAGMNRFPKSKARVAGNVGFTMWRGRETTLENMGNPPAGAMVSGSAAAALI